jgi:hypothetical protein
LTDTAECFTYTATGKRASMIDASGTTMYTYVKPKSDKTRLIDRFRLHHIICYENKTRG